MRILKTIILGLALLWSTSARSQDCNDVLFDANNLYKLGNLQETSRLLESCVSSLESDDQRFEAYRLLAIVYQDLNQIDDMNATIENMLQIQPDYQKYPNSDPLQFTKAVGMFVVEPSLNAGIHVDITANSPVLIKSYSAIYGKDIYPTFSGYSIGTHVSKNIKYGMSLSGVLSYSGTGISHTIEFDQGWEKQYSERIQMADLSLTVKRNVSLPHNMSASLGLAPGAAYITSSRVNINTLTPTGEILIQYSKSGIDERQKLQPNIGLVGGVEIPVNRGSFGLQFGYYFFSNTTVDSDMRGADSDFIYSTQYVNDDIKLRLLKVGLSYSLPVSYSIKR